MFLKKINRLNGRVGVRLTLWHLSLLVLSSCVLFIIFYYRYSQSLTDRDHQVLEAKFKEFNALYQIGGIKSLENYLKTNQTIAFEENNDFFVRIESANHNTRLFQTQGKATLFNLREIEHGLYDVSDKQHWFYIKTKREEDDLEVFSIKLSNGEFLQVGKPVDDRDDLLERFEETFLEVLLCAMILGGFGGYFLSNRALKPIRRLIYTLKSINKGDDQARVPVTPSHDELEELTLLFNQMLDHIKSSNQAMRNTLDIVAHELRTPLTSIRGLAEVNLHKNSISESEYRLVLENCIEGIDEILSEFKMMTDITEVESGLQNLKKEEINLHSICQDIIDLYEIVADQKDIQILLESTDDLIIKIDRKKIRQALANLIDNAIKYSPENSQIKISYYKHNQQAIIRVLDQGIGILENELPHIWKRLYRGENSRSEKGIGLGLSLVKSIVEAHQGSIEVETQIGLGACFIIKLPLR